MKTKAFPILEALSTLMMPIFPQSGNSNLITPKILYVGGTGPGNYTSIQDAINDADLGDIVFVCRGAYNETIQINKTIMLIGEDKNSTVIESKKYTTVTIISAGTTLRGFTIKNRHNLGCAIEVRGNSNQIVDNRIEDSHYGVKIYGEANNIAANLFKKNRFAIISYGNSNIIPSNTFYDNANAIQIFSSGNRISGNTIRKGDFAICIFSGDYNLVCNNDIFYQIQGIYVRRSFGNRIIENVIGGCDNGIYIDMGLKNLIMRNDFIGNDLHAFFNKGFNIWLRNYWGRSYPMFFIPGMRDFHGKMIKSFALDIFPAKRPLTIVGDAHVS